MERNPQSDQRDEMKNYLFQVLEVLLLLVFVTLAGLLFVHTLNYTMPFVLGIFIALLLQPLVRFFERRGLKRSFAILCAMTVTLVLFLTLVSYAILKVSQEIALLIDTFPASVNQISQWLTEHISQGRFFLGQLSPQIVDSLNRSWIDILDKVKAAVMGGLTQVLHGFAALPEEIFIIIIALIAAYFFLLEREKIVAQLYAILPPTWGGKVAQVVSDVNQAFVGLLRAQLILLLMTIAFAVVGLLLLRVPYALTFGLLIGVAGMVPAIGTGLVIFPWAIYELVIGDYWMIVKLLTLQGLIAVMRHVLEPKVYAENVGLGTLTTLFAMYVGMRGFGVIGLFLGPIILIGLRSLLRAKMFADMMPREKL